MIEYREGSRAETEPDVEWLIQRRPSVALIDELAHTNAADAPTEKRYQDVERLLDWGIDVWTTVNVQHIESLQERVRALTGVEVRETFPDRILHTADEIRLVDLSPGALRERIARGLVYSSDRVDQALTGFFTVANLTALRALVLHELAEAAAAQVRAVLPGADVRPNERVLVATGGRRESATRLIHAGARVARRSDGDLYVLVVEPEDGRLPAETAEILDGAERLTASLGGTFLRRRSAESRRRSCARQRPRASRSWWSERADAPASAPWSGAARSRPSSDGCAASTCSSPSPTSPASPVPEHAAGWYGRVEMIDRGTSDRRGPGRRRAGPRGRGRARLLRVHARVAATATSRWPTGCSPASAPTTAASACARTAATWCPGSSTPTCTSSRRS